MHTVNWPSLLVGFGFLALGFYTLYLRIGPKKPFAGLENIQFVLGPRWGAWLHWIAFTWMPLFFGAINLSAGFSGLPLF